MALGKNRTLLMGQTPHAHEKEAIDFALGVLPSSDPYQAWGLFELYADEGRLYEVDLLVLGYSGLYLIEIKSRPGVYRGDHQDWRVEAPDRARPVLMDNSYRLTNHKAKVLSSLLRRKLARPPWVYPLVFLSAAEVELRLDAHADTGVVTRKTLAHGAYAQHGKQKRCNPSALQRFQWRRRESNPAPSLTLITEPIGSLRQRLPFASAVASRLLSPATSRHS